MLASLVLSQLAALPDALLALWLALLGEGVVQHRSGLVEGAAIGLAVSAAATWFLRTLSTRLQRRFRDKVTIALESHVAQLQASISTIAHQERPEYLDRLSMLRNQVFVLDHMYVSLFSTLGWVLRLAVTMALLASIHPALLLLAVFAIPTVLTSSSRPRSRELHRSAARKQAGFRVTCSLLPLLRHGQRSAHYEYRRPVDTRPPCGVAGLVFAPGVRPLDLGVLARSGMGRIRLRLRRSRCFRFVGAPRPAGQVLLVLAAGARLSAYVGATVGEIGFLRGFWADGSRRLAWLEDYAAPLEASGDLPVPAMLRTGIRLEDVSFAYPGTSRLVLENVSVTLPAGSVVAIVGENGAGKTTLVKLLAKLYEPSSGSILLDDTPLGRLSAGAWRSRLAGAFQDFFRFEFKAKQTIGLGDVSRLENEPAVVAAVDRAGAGDVVVRLKSGLDTQLGPTWPSGVDLSFGQWQKLALARGFMRDEPLLLILDEPTAALDAETEHALFERYAAAARGEKGANGRITILVSHRFSTVRMANLIVVLDGARLVEVGSHEELMAKDGQYSELYAIQAAAYR